MGTGSYSISPIIIVFVSLGRFDVNSALGQEEMAMYDLIARMLDYDPTFRITLKEALRHHYFDKLTISTIGGSVTTNSQAQGAGYAQQMMSSQQKMADMARHILRLQIWDHVGKRGWSIAARRQFGADRHQLYTPGHEAKNRQAPFLSKWLKQRTERDEK